MHSDWASGTVESGLVEIIDYRGKTPPKSPAGIPLVSAKHVKGGKLDFSKPEFISHEDYARWTTRGITEPGDVFITTEAPVGEVAPHPKSGLIQISRRVMALRADERLLHWRFLLYVLQSRAVQSELLGRNRGTTVPRVLKPDITGLEIPLPPLPEQRRIAAVLGALDDKIELNRKMNRTLEAMAQALFKSWFIDFDGHDDLVPSELGPIPRGWEAKAVYSAAEYVNGAAFRKFLKKGEPHKTLPVIKIREIKDGISDNTVFIDVGLPEKYRIDTGEILFCWSGSPDTSIGTFIWTQGEAWLNQHIFKVVPHEPTEQYFVYYLLCHLEPVFIEIARDKQTTGLGHVTAKALKRLLVAIPPRAEVERFNAVVRPLFEQVLANSLQSATLAALRDTLLPKLISGELRIPNAEKLVEDALA